LVRTFGWSLHDIDETDVESLLTFVSGLTGKKPAFARKRGYCDQVDWL